MGTLDITYSRAELSARKRLLTFMWCTLLPMLACCSGSRESGVIEKYGMAESIEGRSIAEQAILLVNLVLPPEVPTRLEATWPSCGYFPAQTFAGKSGGFATTFVTGHGFDNGVVFTNADIVKVFLLDGDLLGNIETAFVPEGEHYIFINSRSLERLFQAFYMSGTEAMQQHNSFDKALVLALVMLHEVGHIHFRDSGKYVKPARLNLEEIGKPSGTITNREVRADRYATEILQIAWLSKEMKSPLYGPYGRAFISSNVFRAIATGSNSFDFRRDPRGILNGKPNPALFKQTGYSHLNIYVRLLVMLQQLDPAEDQMKELRWIDEMFAKNQSPR